MTTHRRTLYGAIVQTAQLLGCPLPILANSTLNQKFGVQADATLGANEIPKVVGFCVGIGGHDSSKSGGRTLITSLDHQSIHSGLFDTLPCVLREVGNDLTASERMRYALRATITVSGVNYIAYWLRRMDTTGAVIRSELRTVANNQTTTTDFVPSIADLSPTATLPDPNQANPTNGQYVVASAQVPIRLDAFDITEMLAAAAILFGSEQLAFISEIALCTGFMRQVSSSDGAGGSISVQEVIACQISSFIQVMQPLQSQRDGITLTYDLGATEPLGGFAP